MELEEYQLCILVPGGELKSTKVGMTKKNDFLSWIKENI